jgi:hypothetical protein
MIAEIRRHGLLMVGFVLAGSVCAFSQGTPVTVGPLTVTVPPGWNVPADRAENQGVQIYSADSTLQQYLQVQVFAPQQITQSAREYHALMIQRFSAVIPPGSPQQGGVLGPFIFTRFMMQLGSDPPHAMVWYSAKSGSQYLAITAEATNPDLMTRNLPALEAMVRGATIGGAPAAAAPSAPPATAGNSAGPQSNTTGPDTVSEYVFTAPPGWTGTKYPDGSVGLMSPVLGSERCIINILPMRPAGANLLTDAYSTFQDVWKDFQLTDRTPRGSAMPQLDVHGISGQGWEYVIVKRGIAPRGSRESRLGFVFVAKLNNRLAVIAGLSKDPLLSACMGELQHNVWPRFFYSLSFTSWTTTDQSAAMRKRIEGVWTIATATAASRFTFAANGRYASGAASQQYSSISNMEVLTTTQGFFGDGAYTLRGNAITLTPDSQKNNPQQGFIRVEEESKDGGKTWVEKLYLLRTSTVNGEEYETPFHKN